VVSFHPFFADIAILNAAIGLFVKFEAFIQFEQILNVNVSNSKE